VICVISFGFEKIPQKYPQQLHQFSGVKNDFSYETNLITQNNYIRMFTKSILRCLKQAQILAKTFHLLSSTWNFILQTTTNFRSNSCKWLKHHDYNNLAFEVYANKS
jgi:hypothetical protein